MAQGRRRTTNRLHIYLCFATMNFHDFVAIFVVLSHILILMT